MQRVTIAVLTYRRLDELAALLPLLCEQTSTGADAQVRVLVVDNDPSGAARDVVAEFAARAPVTYANETTPGIAAARNRALTESAEDDVLVFIDDDERPGPNWLSALLRTHASSGAEAVAGPVRSVFTIDPSDWILAGKFFEHPRHQTGDRLPSTATNNLLLDMVAIRRLGLTFDPRFGLTGGEDSLFTHRLTRAGGRIIWSAEAEVVELVPPARATRRWVLARALRNGNSWSRVRLEITNPGAPRLVLRLKYTARGLARIALNVGRFVVALARRDIAGQAQATGAVLGGLGLVLGAWSLHLQEYRRPRRRASSVPGTDRAQTKETP